MASGSLIGERALDLRGQNSAVRSSFPRRMLTIVSVRILPVRAQAPVIALPERLRVHVRMQLGSRNHEPRMNRWHW